MIEAPSYVYVIESTSGHVKIGKSNDPERRLTELKRTQGPYEYNLIWTIPFPSEEEALSYEQLCHMDYEDTRSRGEWFKLSTRDLIEFGYTAQLVTMNYLDGKRREVIY